MLKLPLLVLDVRDHFAHEVRLIDLGKTLADPVGALIEARAFSESGTAFGPAEARALAATDLANDIQFYATLDDIVRTHRPPCAPASDRLERS